MNAPFKALYTTYKWALTVLFQSFFHSFTNVSGIAKANNIILSSDNSVNKCESYKCNKQMERIIFIALEFAYLQNMGENKLSIINAKM